MKLGVDEHLSRDGGFVGEFSCKSGHSVAVLLLLLLNSIHRSSISIDGGTGFNEADSTVRSYLVSWRHSRSRSWSWSWSRILADDRPVTGGIVAAAA